MPERSRLLWFADDIQRTLQLQTEQCVFTVYCGFSWIGNSNCVFSLIKIPLKNTAMSKLYKLKELIHAVHVHLSDYWYALIKIDVLLATRFLIYICYRYICQLEGVIFSVCRRSSQLLSTSGIILEVSWFFS